MAFALDIDHNGKIKGNAKFSETGNKDELATVFTKDADAPVTGTVTVTTGKNKLLMKLEKSSFTNLKSAKSTGTLMNDSKASADIDAMLNEMKTIIVK